MPRIARLSLTREFRAAVRADQRGIVRLAQVVGVVSYPSLSRLLTRVTIPATDLNRDRLARLASAISFTGEVFRGR